MGGMSRLRRLVVSDRWFFITCRRLPRRRIPSPSEFATRAKVEYLHLNPVKAGLVKRPEDWPWSSVHDYTGSVNDRPATPSGLSVDRGLLPADQYTRI